uniref:Uncharacterized protein n=1 Tax=Arundo donax TaxID=35708 RepID=A0A0A9H8H9_ARUDO
MSVFRSLPGSAAPEPWPGSAAPTSTISASGWSRTEESRSMRQEEQMPVRSCDGCLPHRGGSGSDSSSSFFSPSGSACSCSSIGLALGNWLCRLQQQASESSQEGTSGYDMARRKP